MKKKLENLKVTSFVTHLNPNLSKTIAGGLEIEKLPDTWRCPSVNRCASVDGYTCPVDDGPKPEGPLPKL